MVQYNPVSDDEVLGDLRGLAQRTRPIDAHDATAAAEVAAAPGQGVG